MGKTRIGGVALGGEHPAGDFGRVVDGDGVGHGADGGESSGGGGSGAGRDGLFVSLAGFAEVDVDVDEARGYDEAFGVDGLRVRVLDFAGLVDGSDFAFGEQEITRGVDAAGGIDEVSVADEDGFHRAFFSFAPPRARPIAR